MLLLNIPRTHITRNLSRGLRALNTKPNYPDPNASKRQETFAEVPRMGMATPRQLVEYLNQYIVGQEHAKKVLSVAVFNHYSRVYADDAITQRDQYDDSPVEDPAPGIQTAKIRPLRSPPSSMFPDAYPRLEKSNVLVIGPTGSGKTLLAKTLARVLDVPFSVSDATSFTQAGYVGEDVEMAIQRLNLEYQLIRLQLQDAQWNPYRASMGIVYIDEIDKIARKTGSGTDGSRDVSGEGVQQGLLRMIEGSVISIQAKGSNAEPPPPPGGQGHWRGRASQVAVAPKPDMYHIDTSNILFIVSGAFVGLDKCIEKRVSKGRSIGFSSTSSQGSAGSPLFFTPNQKPTDNILELVDPADLVQYGFIPEFISRLPSITSLAPLTIPDLRKILTEVKGSILSQYKALFEYSNVEIRFTSAALDEICRKAFERGGGARGLRGIMETLLLEPMYEVPGSDIRSVLITEKVVKGEQTPQYWRSHDSVAFWEAWSAEELKYKANKR